MKNVQSINAGSLNNQLIYISLKNTFVAHRDWNFILYFRRDEEFACKNGGQCLPITKICDGARHCLDASDESTEMCHAREYVLHIQFNLSISTSTFNKKIRSGN